MRRVADLSKLLTNTVEAYYWLGFLMADGHFYETAIKLHLANKDKYQVDKFRKFINYVGRAKENTVNIMNPYVVERLRNKFNISSRKTYYPCDIKGIKCKKLLFSLITGMFDGDGYVCTRSNGKVNSLGMKLHKNWLSNLEYIEKFLYNYLNIEKRGLKSLARLNKRGYAVLLFSDLSLLAAMKRKIINLKLPVMERKWRLIDENITIRKDQMDEKTWREINFWLKKGLKRKEIADKVGVRLKSLNVRIWRRTSGGKMDM